MPKGQKPMAGAGPLPKTPDGKVPGWLRRALNKSTPPTKDQETMRTESASIARGVEILYPTVRMVGGKLKKLSSDEAYDTALKKKDFVITKGRSQATALSKRLSAKVGRVREMK